MEIGIKGKWDEMKGEIRKTWGKLTSDELEQTKGDLSAIKGLIQQKYGEVQDDVVQRLGKIRDRFTDATKDALRDDKDDRDVPH